MMLHKLFVVKISFKERPEGLSYTQTPSLLIINIILLLSRVVKLCKVLLLQ